jgi:tetratricopeptide (TPR) repeat protein
LTGPNHFYATILADQNYQRGKDLEQQGYWQQALTCFRRACSQDRTNGLYLVARGRLCQAHDLEPEAAECYEVALSLDPDDTVALFNQAQLFASQGRLDDARANLLKIAAGDVAVLGDRAAPVFCRLGDLALRREEYAAAAIHYRKALEVAAEGPSQRYAAASLSALDRLAEFEQPVGADGRILPKVALYAYAGAMVLGMPDDDGIHVPLTPGLGFDSLDEVALALGRFLTLAKHYAWSPDVVVALDAESRPLVLALADALGATACHEARETPWGSVALGVTATGSDPSVLRESMVTLEERASRRLLYAVRLRHAVWDYVAPVAPNVVTLPVRLEFPWHKGEAGAPEHAEAYGAALSEKLAALTGDPRLEAQLRAQLEWYAAHNRLGFDPRAWPECVATPDGSPDEIGGARVDEMTGSAGSGPGGGAVRAARDAGGATYASEVPASAPG